MKQFNENQFLKKLRLEREVKAVDIANAIGKSRSYVSQVENNKRCIPKKRVLVKWIKAIGITKMKYYEELCNSERGQSESHVKNNEQSFETMFFDSFLNQKLNLEERYKNSLSKFNLFLDRQDYLKNYNESIGSNLSKIRFETFIAMEKMWFDYKFSQLFKEWISLSLKVTDLLNEKVKTTLEARSNDLFENFLVNSSLLSNDIFSELLDRYQIGPEVVSLELPGGEKIEYDQNYPIWKMFEDESILSNPTSKTRWTINFYIWSLKKVFELSRIKHRDYQHIDEYNMIYKLIRRDFRRELSSAGVCRSRYEYISNKIMSLKESNEHKYIELLGYLPDELRLSIQAGRVKII